MTVVRETTVPCKVWVLHQESGEASRAWGVKACNRLSAEQAGMRGDGEKERKIKAGFTSPTLTLSFIERDADGSGEVEAADFPAGWGNALGAGYRRWLPFR